MNRQSLLLSAVAAVLVLAVYWMFLLSPKRKALVEAEAEIAAAIDQQASLQNRINALRDVRAQAPSVEARLAATEALLPADAALPATLRQLQLAADESGMVLSALSPGTPAAVDVEGVPPGVSQMSLSLSMTGSYFQVIDFLRRIGDPTITPRAILFDSISLGPAGYPTLSVSLSGRMFVVDRVAIAGGEE